MNQILIWVISFEIIGLASFMITFNFFHLLNDRGFAISKILGISIFSLLSWTVSISNIIPRHTLTLYIILSVLFIVAIKLWYRQRHEVRNYLFLNWKKILWLQSIYFIIFATFILLRYIDPLINHTEQPMDLAFLTASINTISGIPLDPWLKGEVLNYYYFGYWIFSDISKISFLNPEVSYNLAISTIPALVGISIAGLVINVMAKSTLLKVQIFISGLASLFSCFLSNIYGLLAWLNEYVVASSSFWNSICIEGLSKPEIRESLNWYPTKFWWWFSSSRIINFFGTNCGQNGSDYTITESPFFSYLLGDLHPHVMASPFIIAFITICLFLSKSSLQTLKFNTILAITMTTLMMSICNFINMWNGPILISILYMVFIAKKINNPNKSLIKILTIPTIITVGSFLIILPYVFNAGESITGLYASHTHTHPIHGLIIWLPLWVIIIPYSIKDFMTSKISKNIKTPIVISILITSIPWIIKIVLPMNQISSGPGLLGFAIPISFMVFITTFSATNHTSEKGLTEKATFSYILSLGFLLVLIPELFYVGDIFQNRMNTVFKFYYYAWILFSLGAAYSFKHLYPFVSIKNKLKVKLIAATWSLCALITILMGLYFVPASVKSKLDYSEFQSLNGLINIKKDSPDIYDAIEFVRMESSSEDGILEAVGEWDQSGLFSSTTGIQNIINWPGHQIQWRGDLIELSKRTQDVETIYKTTDTYIAKTKLDFYSIKYAVVGPQEVLKYGETIGSTFENIGLVVFQNNTLKIYKFETK